MRRLLALFIVALMVTLPGVEAVAPVAAQQRGYQQQAQPRNPISAFFNALFGGLSRRRQAPQPMYAPPSRAPRYVPRQSRGHAPGRTKQRERTPAVVAAQKDEDARQVVVFGAFFAAGLEDGLRSSFVESTMVAIDGVTSPSSGLVRTDHFDWPATIRAWLDDPEKRTDIAVVMIGANDSQPLADAVGEHEAGSERWRELYGARIDEIMKIFLERGIPLYWVSLPPVAADALRQDYAYFNDIYRERAYRNGIEFVDIWSSFLDEAGRYTATGPDVNGEQRQLRAEDGLHFTDAGNRKLAHFVAREIRRDFNREDGLFIALPEGEFGPQPFMPGEEQLKTGIGEVVPLTGAQGMPMSLAGGPEPDPEAPEDSVYYQAILLGDAPEAAPGRAGDFSWPRRPQPLPAPSVASAPKDAEPKAEAERTGRSD